MYVGLMENGKYEILKSDKDIFNNKSRYKLCIFDCSSSLKGPAHVIVKSKDIRYLPDELRIEVTVNIINPNSGLSYIDSVKLDYEIENLSMLYSVVSNIYQYDLFNAYMAEITYDLDIVEYTMMIEDIRIFHTKSNSDTTLTFKYYYDVPCDFLDKFLKSVNMNVVTDKVFKIHQYLILDTDGFWYFAEKVPSTAKYIGISIGGNTMYFINYKKYKRINKVSTIEVSIGGIGLYEVSEYDQIFTFYECCLNYSALIVIPQYILLFINFINPNILIYTSITLDDGTEYKLTTSTDELMKYGYSLFSIIDKLTKI